MTCLSHEEFITGCREFLKTSEKLGDSWKLCSPSQDADTYYLSKTQCFSDNTNRESQRQMKQEKGVIDEPQHDDNSPSDSSNEPIGTKEQRESELGDIMEDEPPHDPSSVDASFPGDFITYEYHIVYSFSHSVPALYFNAWYSSGKMLTLQEVWRRVNVQFSEQVEKTKWDSLTQNEHPVLGRPFFQLHPCHTAKLMGKLGCDEHTPATLKKYLISWLSMFGPVVGLKMSLSYFTMDFEARPS